MERTPGFVSDDALLRLARTNFYSAVLISHQAVRDVQNSPVISSQPGLEPMERPRTCPVSSFLSMKPVQVGGGSRPSGLNRPVAVARKTEFFPSFLFLLREGVCRGNQEGTVGPV